MDSIPETFGFDTSVDAGVDQQICWNNLRSSARNMLPDYINSPGDPIGGYLNSMIPEGQNLSGWNAGEPSSSGTENHVSHIERKVEHGWSAPMMASASRAGPELEERQYETALSLNNAIVQSTSSNQIANVPLFVQSSSNAIPQDLNMSAGFVAHGSDDSYIMDANAYKADGSKNLRIPSASSSSNPFGVPSSSSSSDGRRFSCKRKALEGNTGQSSIAGSSSYFQHAESSVWHAVPGRHNAGRSLSISTPSDNILGVNPSEQVNARLGLVIGGTASESPLALNVAGNTEASMRNYRARISPSRQQGNVDHSNVSSQQESLRLTPLDNSLDMRSPPLPDTRSSQRQSMVVHVPALRRSSHSYRWSGGASSRPGHPSSSGERDAVLHEESSSIRIPRNISEHPMFIPASVMRNSAQDSSLTGGNVNVSVNVGSNTQNASSSGVHRVSGPNLVPRRNPPQYPRRLSELVRRSLLSSAVSESGGPSSSNSPGRSGPSLQEMALASGAGNQAHHLSHSRAGILFERQLDGALGIPSSLRTLAAASEGRSRLVSEIRNVLDLMRRGEGLRFEDVMVLDQSVFFGMADIHDRHRDMRLDVDNMSYEELLALEERIGNVSTGLSEEIILNRLKQRKYFSIAMGAQPEEEPCCVCQEEYNDGEDVGTLDCGHEFHTDCIKQWLINKNSCPICKTTALNK